MKQENMTIIENNRVTKDVHEIVLRGKTGCGNENTGSVYQYQSTA